jgi:hypothetical protein
VLSATPTIGDSDDTGATVSYQWQNSSDGSSWSNITGSTGSTYVVAEGDENKLVRVHASFTDDTSVLLSADSAATASKVVDNSSLSLSITGKHHTGFTLTASATIGDSDDTGASLAYQWQRSTDGGTTWSNISGATGSTYVTLAPDLNNRVAAPCGCASTFVTTQSTGYIFVKTRSTRGLPHTLPRSGAIRTRH